MQSKSTTIQRHVQNNPFIHDRTQEMSNTIIKSIQERQGKKCKIPNNHTPI
jgi:hypothetical protein